MSGTVTELAVLDRLSPITENVTTSWPFVPKEEMPVEKKSTLDPTKTSRVVGPNTVRARLSRSASLDRIRQFPAYICSTGLLPHLQNFLQTSTTVLQVGLAFVRSYLLVVAVYLSCFILTLQLSACFCALIVGAKPPGLIFMVASLLLMCAMACKTIVHDSAVKHSSRTRSD